MNCCVSFSLPIIIKWKVIETLVECNETCSEKFHNETSHIGVLNGMSIQLKTSDCMVTHLIIESTKCREEEGRGAVTLIVGYPYQWTGTLSAMPT